MNLAKGLGQQGSSLEVPLGPLDPHCGFLGEQCRWLLTCLLHQIWALIHHIL